MNGQLVGLTGMALVSLDENGLILDWNRCAEILFGTSGEEAVGSPFSLLFKVTGEAGPWFDGTRPPPEGAIAFTTPVLRQRPLKLRNIAWWIYPIPSPRKMRLLAFAVACADLKTVPLSLSVGDQLVVRPHGTADRRGLRVPSSAPCVVPVDPRYRTRLESNLSEALRILPPGRRDQAAAQILALGSPGVSLVVSARLPFDARDGAVPEATTFHVTAAPRQLAFLSQVSTRIGSRLDPLTTAAELAEAVVPRLADFCEVHLLDDICSGPGPGPGRDRRPGDPWVVRRVARAGPVAGPAERPAEGAVEVPVGSLLAHTMNTGELVHLPRAVGEPAYGDPLLACLPDLGPLTLVPLVARGAVMGNLLLAHAASRPPMAAHDFTVTEEVVRIAATAIADAGLLQRESHIAEALQASLLPRRVPDLAGIRVSHRYLPGSSGARAGGDWYDVISLPRGRVALTVGDVMGHDWRSAATMGQLRTAIQAFAVLDLGPEDMLRRLDALAQRLCDGSMATCLYAVYDPSERHCRIANAGHLPPVLVSPDGRSRLLPVPPGVPIGVGGHAFGVMDLPVEDDWRMVLYTDGLVERPGHDIETRLEELRAHLSGPPPLTLDDLCDNAVPALLGGWRHDDDVALLAAEFQGPDRLS
ncbi:SpoIIE family protein phosphatase [Spirillospora sp. NPDC047279]|uniref:PP2C family protein-serine/threonine phosphatase n=1 Tax=Spirillospora sp. NPDC047279 TaxID=3155478 RepID=UPI003407C43F